MSSELVLTAVIKAAPGKGDRIHELLVDLAKYVKENEPDTLRYNVHRENKPEDPSTPTFIVLETYKDEAALATHRASGPYKTFFKTGEEEKLVSTAPIICVSQPIGGFESR